MARITKLSDSLVPIIICTCSDNAGALCHLLPEASYTTATQLLYDDDETTIITITTTTTADTITNKPPLPGMGVSDPPDNLLPEDKYCPSSYRQRKSSFHDELLSHFEKRLSDLGPRKWYPYVKQIDCNQREIGLQATH